MVLEQSSSLKCEDFYTLREISKQALDEQMGSRTDRWTMLLLFNKG